jgi:excinuclease ABC subunit A
MTQDRPIQIRGLRLHNLRNVDIDIPRGKLVVISGVSGSGKSSLAFDTLFAEGQRRYVETFSAYTRQFLERIDRPDADAIENIPPAIAIRQRATSRGSRSTVGSVTEINDYLRLLFAKIGRVFCQGCGQEVRSDTPRSAADAIDRLPAGAEYLVTFPIETPKKSKRQELARALLADGFVRAITKLGVVKLDESPLDPPADGQPLRVVVDRLIVGRSSGDRLVDSLETAFAKGNGRCHIVMAADPAEQLRFSLQWRCERCDRDYPAPEQRLFSSNNPLGACPECNGFGDVVDIDMDRVVPDRSKSLRDGAIAPWNAPAYAHELEELAALADDYNIPLDVPFEQLSPQQLELIHDGVPARKFGGLAGFFRWLERKKYKMHIRVFLGRWRTYRKCPVCHGRRLRDVALATRVGGRSIAELWALEVRAAMQFFGDLRLTPDEQAIGRVMLDQVVRRLAYLDEVGLGYLTLDRPIRTLSGGESQRVALTRALGAGLVNTLYVLDEPSIGLHDRDTHRLIEIVRRLRDSRNSVVVVEHDESFLRAADHLVDLGPGAGAAGGRIVFDGPLAELDRAAESATADFLQGRRRIATPAKRRPCAHGSIRLRGARGNNLKNIDVDFPLGLLCVVTGVSGSGKSSLVEDTLYPAVCRALKIAAPAPAEHDAIDGVGQIGDCVLVDQSPIGRSSRSNPITYIKAFDDVRRAFAETTEAKIHNFGPGHFSFNVDLGRCAACEGQGVQIIDMQFLADVSVTCPECGGLRFRREILDVKYRGKSIAEVLDMSVREAIAFFRGRTKVLEALAPLVGVGLDYLKLGQPADTLSGGEAQRLKLAGRLSSASHERTLLILDEPTTGLHAADIAKLIECFNSLLAVGHSLVVVEHNLEIIKCADWIIDLGPEAAADGGQVVASGTPEQVARTPHSHTGVHLARALDIAATSRPND